jgi:transposase
MRETIASPRSLKSAHEHVERLGHALREQCAQWRMKDVANALMCLRDLNFTVAATFPVEAGDASRVADSQDLLKNLRSISSESPPGNICRRVLITKAAKKHLRRIPVDVAWT